jgi:hypothetical protein
MFIITVIATHMLTPIITGLGARARLRGEIF